MTYNVLSGTLSLYTTNIEQSVVIVRVWRRLQMSRLTYLLTRKSTMVSRLLRSTHQYATVLDYWCILIHVMKEPHPGQFPTSIPPTA